MRGMTQTDDDDHYHDGDNNNNDNDSNMTIGMEIVTMAMTKMTQNNKIKEVTKMKCLVAVTTCMRLTVLVTEKRLS